MHTITDCIKCKNDFMYHSTDYHLSRPVATDPDTGELCSFGYICQDCHQEQLSIVEKAFRTTFGKQCDELYITTDTNRLFIRQHEAAATGEGYALFFNDYADYAVGTHNEQGTYHVERRTSEGTAEVAIFYDIDLAHSVCDLLNKGEL